MNAYDILVQKVMKDKNIKPMNIIMQPKNSRCCGQACVAMVLGITLEESISLFSHDKGTKTKDLVRVLNQQGYSCKERLTPLRNGTLPPIAICKIVRKQHKNGRWHWIVHNHGMFFDPSFGIFIDIDNVRTFYRDWEITSFLEIK